MILRWKIEQKTKRVIKYAQQAKRDAQKSILDIAAALQYVAQKSGV